MASTLEDVAVAAEESAKDQREVARALRGMQRQRERGASWAAILDRGPQAGVLARLRRSASRLRDASTGLASILARGLSSEGESRRTIGRRLGVTHQRVSALLNVNGPRRSAPGPVTNDE